SISEKVLAFSKTNYEKAKIYALKGNLERAMGIDKAYIKNFEEGIRLLGYQSLIKKCNLIKTAIAVLRFKSLFLHAQPPIKELPLEDNAEQSLIYALTERIAEEAYFEQDIIRYVYIITSWAYATYEKHNRELRSAFYSVNGAL